MAKVMVQPKCRATETIASLGGGTRAKFGVRNAGMIAALFAMTACATLTPQQQTDINAGLTVAAAATSIYAARPDADPKVVAQLRALLAAAQSAAQTAQANPGGSAEQNAAGAALAALVAYESQIAFQPAAK